MSILNTAVDIIKKKKNRLVTPYLVLSQTIKQVTKTVAH